MPRADGKRSPRRPLCDSWIVENLTYDPASGQVFRGARLLGNPDSKGYLRTQLLGNFVRIHRLAWFLGHGRWPSKQIDHIDGDKRNNRLSNLRDVDAVMNIQNRRHAAGVQPAGKKFAASIYANGRRRSLGTFLTREAARSAYEAARSTLHPGFAG